MSLSGKNKNVIPAQINDFSVNFMAKTASVCKSKDIWVLANFHLLEGFIDLA